MATTQDRLIELQGRKMELITFKELIEEICDVDFHEIYPPSIEKGISDDYENNME